jgi:hypothetical protein
MIWHLHLLENFDRDDVETRPSVDESAVDGDVVNGGRTHDWNRTNCPGGDWMVLFVEAKLVGGPLQPWAVSAWLCYRDLLRQLFEVAI